MTPVAWSTIGFWGVVAGTAFVLYRAWVEWRRVGRTRLVESMLILALLLVGILLRGAPDAIRYTQSAIVMIAVLAQVWRDRRTFFRSDPMLWLLGALVALIVILEVDHDLYPLLPHSAQRALLGLMVVVSVLFLAWPIIQLTKLTKEGRRVIAEAREMLKTAAEAERRKSAGGPS